MYFATLVAGVDNWRIVRRLRHKRATVIPLRLRTPICSRNIARSMPVIFRIGKPCSLSNGGFMADKCVAQRADFRVEPHQICGR